MLNITGDKKKKPQAQQSFCFTIDADWIPGSEAGLEMLIDFCDKHLFKATILIAGRFASSCSQIIKEAAGRGFAIGTHGWEHGLNTEENFRSATYLQQKRWIQDATEAVEKASGVCPRIFRAPFLAISETTYKVLEEMEYRIDSSVPSRRFDFYRGTVNYRRYFWAPLAPYHPSPDNIAIRGKSRILEIPPSAFMAPINMKALRTLNFKAVAWCVRRVALRSPVLVFYVHPAEFVAYEYLTVPRSMDSWFKAGGMKNFPALERFLEYIKALGYSFRTLSDIYSA